MSPRFEVIEAKRFHCGMMTRIMRRSYLTMMAQAGADPHRELRACFDQSAFRKAWMIDGRLAALGGVIGTLASGDGMVWLALSEEATRYPKAIIKEARRQIDGLMRTKRELRASIFEGDGASVRLAVFLRFQVIGAAWDGPAETRFGRRLLAREIAGNADARITIGNSFMVPMFYREAA